MGSLAHDVKHNHLYVRRSITRVGGKYEFGPTKTGKGARIVPLAPDVLAVLEGHRERQEAERVQADDLYNAEGLVFCNLFGAPITPMAQYHVWKRLQARAEVPKVRLHDVRHLNLSLLVRHGLDPRTIADRIGHSDPAFTLRKYSHMFAEHRTEEAISLAELFAPRGALN